MNSSWLGVVVEGLSEFVPTDNFENPGTVGPLKGSILCLMFRLYGTFPFEQFRHYTDAPRFIESPESRRHGN